MKKIIVLLLIGLSFALSGCSEDGEDGLAYLQFWWTGSLYYYYDNNPDIPNLFYSNTYYAVSPGTYNFSYTSWDSSSWSGTYTITIDEGEDGAFPFFEGTDGVDSYFELSLYSFGPTFNDWGSYAARIANDISLSRILSPEEEEEYALPKDDVKEVMKDNNNLFTFFNPDSENVITEEFSQGRYKVVLKYTIN